MKLLRSASAVALLLCSVLIGLVIGSPAAQATSTGWEQVSINIDLGKQPDMTCYANFRMTSLGSVTVIDEAPNGRCDAGPNTGPGCNQVGEYGCTDLWWTFKGIGCGTGVVMHPAITEHPDSSTFSLKLALGADQATATGCDPVEVCLDIVTENWGVDQSFTHCQSVGLDPPAPTTSACAYGNVTAARLQTDNSVFYYGPAVGGNSNWFWKTFTATVDGGGTGTWAVYMVYENGTRVSEPLTMTGDNTSPPYLAEWKNYSSINTVAGTGNTALITASNYRVSASRGANASPVIGGTTIQNKLGTTPPDPVALGWTTRNVVGIGAFRVESWSPPAVDSTATQSGLWALGQSANPLSALNNGVVGMNDPAKCAFYFGDKLWNNSTITTDEPAGTITTTDDPGDDPPPLPEPDPEDDPDWSWWAAILAMLGKIWSAVTSVASAIAGLASSIASAIASALSGLAQLILDGIEALFVPADGFSPYFTDMKQSWRDSAPGSFVLGFSEMGVTWPSSGCGGIPVNFSMYSTDVNFNLGAACSGASASAAATVKLVASAGIVVAGGLASVRAIGSGFGWSPGIGRGGRDA